jgi:hypothetical protein
VLGQTQRAPLMLPLAPYALYSVVRAYGYTGPCCQVRRTSDGATRQIGWKNNALSMDEVRAFLGSGAGTVATWYDQSGNGRHLTQGTAATQPAISLANAVDGLCPICIDGNADGLVEKNLSVGSVSLSARAVSVLSVVRPKGSINYSTYFYGNAGATVEFELVTAGPLIGAQIVAIDNTGTPSVVSSSGALAVPTILGLVCSASAVTGYKDGVSNVTGTPMATGTATTFNVGGNADGANVFGAFDVFATVVFNSAISSTNEAAVRAALNASFGTPQRARANLVCDGDSRTYGTEAEYLQSYPWHLGNRLGRQWRVWNMGIGGAQVADMDAGFSTYGPALYDSAQPINLYVCEAGSADVFFNGANATDTYGHIQSLHSQARTLGFETIQHTFGTIATATGPQQTQIDALNALIRAGVGTDFDALADCQANSALDNPGDTTYYAADGLHYTSLANSIIADLVRQAVMSLI